MQPLTMCFCVCVVRYFFVGLFFVCVCVRVRVCCFMFAFARQCVCWFVRFFVHVCVRVWVCLCMRQRVHVCCVLDVILCGWVCLENMGAFFSRNTPACWSVFVCLRVRHVCLFVRLFVRSVVCCFIVLYLFVCFAALCVLPFVARFCVCYACLFACASVFVCVFVAWSLGVGGSALRVPPVETGLTVYRRLYIENPRFQS